MPRAREGNPLTVVLLLFVLLLLTATVHRWFVIVAVLLAAYVGVGIAAVAGAEWLPESWQVEKVHRDPQV